VAEQCGAFLAPAPVVEAVVAHRSLARLGGPIPAGVLTLALRPAASGRCTLVPGGAVAAAVLALDGSDLVLVVPDRRPRPLVNLGSAPLADIDTTDGRRTTLAKGDTAFAAFAAAADEWRALTSCWLVGLGRAALDIGVQYAKDRTQFGVPIGSFQTVAHRLADAATALDGARLLAYKAVWALDRGDPAADARAAMAFAFCGEVAQAAASASLHFHGGYGFMEEYDVQLYFRRAKAARLVMGDPRRELQGLADRLFGPVERHADDLATSATTAGR